MLALCGEMKEQIRARGGSGVDAQSCSHPSHCAWCHHSNPDPNSRPHSWGRASSISGHCPWFPVRRGREERGWGETAWPPPDFTRRGGALYPLATPPRAEAASKHGQQHPDTSGSTPTSPCAQCLSHRTPPQPSASLFYITPLTFGLLIPSIE